MTGGGDERRVKARFDKETGGGSRLRTKRPAIRKRLDRGDMFIEASSSDDDEEEEYVPPPSPPRASQREKGKSVAEASGSRAEPESDEEEFDVEEVLTQSGVQFGALRMHAPNNPGWRARVSYKGKTELVREMRGKDPRHTPREASDYRFHTWFQQDFYESVILSKNHPVALSQWIDFQYMESKNDPIFNEVVAACKSKHVKGIMRFEKNWNNEVIAQFYATVYFEENGIRKLHWMTEGQWFEISFSQFARLFGFGRNDANRPKLHYATPLSQIRMKFMYPRSEEGNTGTTTGLLPFYTYLNRMFRKTIAPREGDATNISNYSKNLLAAMDSNAPPFSVFDFIWEEIKSISRSPLKSCGYAPYIMHMIEKVTGGSFDCEVRHNPLKLKPTLKNPPIPSGGSGASPSTAPPSAARGGGQQKEKSVSPIKKMFNVLFGLCKSISVKQHHERQARKKDTKSIKEIHAAMNIQPSRSPIGSENESSEVEDHEAKFAQYQEADPFAVYYQAEAMAAAMGMGGGHNSGESSQNPLIPPFQPQPQESDGNEDNEGEEDVGDDSE